MKPFHLGKYIPYVWKGINKWGKKAEGIIIAEDDASAENEARRLGVTIHSLKKRSFWLLPGHTTDNIKIIDIVFLMRQLSTLISAGVPLVQSLEIMSTG